MPSKSRFVLCRQFSDVEDELIGDEVRIIRMPEATKNAIAEQNYQSIAKWELFHGGYHHILLNSYDTETKSDAEAEQEIIRALLILKIIQSHSAGLHLVVDAIAYGEGIDYCGHTRLGLGSTTYVCASDLNASVTREHVRQARIMWPQIKTVCNNWQKHRRILRALRFFETACSNYDGGIRLLHFYSALETLLCTSSNQTGQQLIQRVLAIHQCGVIAQDLRKISVMRSGLVHSGAIAEEARGKEEELIQKLERIVRASLFHVLADQESVALFSDPRLIKEKYPVKVKEFTHTETGREIFV